MKMMFVFILCLGLASCKEGFQSVFNPNPTTALSVLEDKSDSDLAKPKAAEVLRLYTLNDDHLHDGFQFRSRSISDISMTRVRSYSVPSVRWYAADDNERVAELKNFKGRIIAVIDSSNEEVTAPKKNSLVYEAMYSELVNLRNSDATNKILVVYSDMLQNTDEFSYYDKSSFEIAKKSPDKVVARFEQIKPLPDLKGIRVYIISNPHSYREEKKFDVAVNVMKILIEQKHGQVIVTPNIIATQM